MPVLKSMNLSYAIMNISKVIFLLRWQKNDKKTGISAISAIPNSRIMRLDVAVVFVSVWEWYAAKFTKVKQGSQTWPSFLYYE